MSITLTALQKQRRDTAANWTAENPTLLAGEIGLESDTGYWKVGDGATAWTSLAYVSGLGAEIPVDRLADGAARQLLQTDAAGTGVEWTDNVDVPGTLDVTGAATFDDDVTIQGDLTVNGTTTTIDTTTLVVEDKNIEIGKVATPTDVSADGGGITLKGSTDKTINWVDATDAWTLSEHVDIASAKEYRIAGIKVLDATSLGSAVVSSSLTSVGTIGTGVWEGTTVGTGYGGTGQTTYTDGELLIGKTDGTLAKATITAGSGVTVTNADGSITIAATGSGGTVTAVTGTSPIASTGGTTPDISIQDATTAQKGAVQLEDSTSSTSTTTAATPNAVKSAYDLANAALPASGGTVTGDVTLNAQADLRFADSDSSNWVAFQAPATVASNVTWTLPDADGTSGQVLSTNGTGTLSWATAAAGVTDKIEEGNTSAEVIDTGSDGRFVVTTEGTEALRVDSSQRVGIGTTSLSSIFHVKGTNAEITTQPNADTESTYLTFRNAAGTSARGFIGYNYTGDYMNFRAGGSGEKMRIDSSGRLLVGTSTYSGAGAKLVVQGSGYTQGGMIIARNGIPTGASDVLGLFIYTDSNYNEGAIISAVRDGGTWTSGSSHPTRLAFSTCPDSGSSPVERMRITSSGELLVGGTNDNGAYNIQCNGTGVWGFGAYVNGSDERLKEDISPLSSTLELVKQLNPVSFRYKEEYTSDTGVQPGFIAQDLQLTLADQPYIDGIVQAGPEFLSVAYQSLIPVLTKALQEAVAKIETLEAKVEALEAQ